MREDRDPHGVGLRRAGEAMGVTRVARLTGLDRTGVEVASAIRPLGHVLQVTNGKGARFADAARGALMEAAELFAAERPACDAWDAAGALERRLGAQAVLSPGALAPGGAEPGWDQVRMAWRAGVDLATGRRVLVPAHAVYVPPPGGALLGPALLRWTSNGMGAAPDRSEALLHALLEAVERDRLARALPAGFTAEEVASRLIDARSLGRAAPETAEAVARIERRGLAVHLLDVSSPARAPAGERLALPCAAALLVDHAHGAVPVAAGYACRLRRDAALAAALLEAAQSRATEIHGAREDVAPGDRGEAVALGRLCAAVRPLRSAAALPDVRARSPRAAAELVLRRLRRAGFGRAVAVDLEGPPGVAVVKVLVPGLLLSELL